MDEPKPDQNNEDQPEPQQATPQAKTKKRSPWERILTWSLIAALLVVVLVEWRSQVGYNQTLTAFKKQIGEKSEEKEITLSDADELVQGYALRSEHESDKRKFVRYRWPSLFKQYVIQLKLGMDNLVLSYETNPDASDE